MEKWAYLKRVVAMATVKSTLFVKILPFLLLLMDIFHDWRFLVLQVDLLKSTSLPLMKRFGLDGEAFNLKVECVLGLSSTSKSKIFWLIYIWWVFCYLVRWWKGEWRLGEEERWCFHVQPAGASNQYSWLTPERSRGSGEWRIHFKRSLLTYHSSCTSL